MRNPLEEMKLLADLAAWMKSHPAAGVSVATVWFEGGDDGFERSCLNQASVDCSPTHLVALADALLERAGQRMTQMADPPRDLIMSVDRARLELDFGFHADAKGTA